MTARSLRAGLMLGATLAYDGGRIIGKQTRQKGFNE